MFPGMSGDFTSENFSATWYIIDNHSSTRSVHLPVHSFICFVSAGCVRDSVCCVRCCSFEQLRMAVGNLKKQATKKNEGSLAYVKGGLSTFFEAQDALAGMSTHTYTNNHQQPKCRLGWTVPLTTQVYVFMLWEVNGRKWRCCFKQRVCV